MDISVSPVLLQSSSFLITSGQWNVQDSS
jgi:hypothetical protein